MNIPATPYEFRYKLNDEQKNQLTTLATKVAPSGGLKAVQRVLTLHSVTRVKCVKLASPLRLTADTETLLSTQLFDGDYGAEPLGTFCCCTFTPHDECMAKVAVKVSAKRGQSATVRSLRTGRC